MFSASSEEKNKKLEIKAGSKDSIFLDIVPKSKKKKSLLSQLSVQFIILQLLLWKLKKISFRKELSLDRTVYLTGGEQPAGSALVVRSSFCTYDSRL